MLAQRVLLVLILLLVAPIATGQDVDWYPNKRSCTVISITRSRNRPSEVRRGAYLIAVEFEQDELKPRQFTYSVSRAVWNQVLLGDIGVAYYKRGHAVGISFPSLPTEDED